MDTFRKFMKVVSLALLFSTIICGYYINANKVTLADYNLSVSFHFYIALLTAIFVTISFLLPNKRGKD